MYIRGQGIIIKNVHKTYKYYVNTSFFKRVVKYEQAVKGISFSVHAGEIIGIVGSNGAGKTSLIKMISGVMKPDSGEILVNGVDPFLKRKEYRKDVSLILGQKGKLHPDMSIYESAILFGSMYGLNKEKVKERLFEMASRLSLEEEYLSKQVRTLSLGQKMKGELCIALVNLPTILFLDEPTIGIDSKSSKAIRGFLVSYCKENNASIILTSHNIKDIEETCNKLLILKQGKAIFSGDIHEFSNRFKFDTKIACQVNNSVMDLARVDDRICIKNEKAVLECCEQEKEELINYLYSKASISGLEVGPKGFEELIEEILYEQK